MTKFAVKNPVTVLVLAFILLVAGWMSYRSMPLESFPEVKIPLIFVNVVYPGASPEDMEKLITKKVEDKLEGVEGLKKVTSQSMESISSLSVPTRVAGSPVVRTTTLVLEELCCERAKWT